MALMKQPMGGMVKPPKMKMAPAPKPIKPIKVQKAPKASFKMPKPGGLKTGGAR